MKHGKFYGDYYRYFFGVVVNVNDPLQIGRIQVRIIGIHPEDKSLVSDEDLPWASVVVPPTEGGVSGIGLTTGIHVSAQVFGIFLDGYHSQIPLVLGSTPKLEFKTSESHQTQQQTQTQDSLPSEKLPESFVEHPEKWAGITLEGSSNNTKAFSFFTSDHAGIFDRADVVAAGIIGNFLQESGSSGDINPLALNRSEGSFGIAQWNPARAAGHRLGKLIDFSSQRQLSYQSLTAQLLFTVYELKTTPYLGLTRLNKQTTPESAAEVFMLKFERPSERYANLQNRQNQARTIYETLSKS